MQELSAVPEALQGEISVSPRVAILAGILVIATYVAWAPFLFPVADDFSPVDWSGLPQTIVHFWLNWGGTWTAVALRWLFAPLVLGGAYWLTPLVCVGIHLGAATIAFRLAAPLEATWGRAVGLAVLWCATYLATMYSSAESIFWATGMLAYEPGNVVALVVSVLALHTPPSSVRSRVSIFLLTPILVGCHYPFALWVLAVLLYRCVQHRWKVQDVGLLLWCIAFVALMLLAPGNFQRHEVAAVERHIGLAKVLFKSSTSFAEFLARELGAVQNWLWLGLAATMFPKESLAVPSSKSARHTLFLSIATCLLPLYAIFLLSSLSGIDPPFARTLNALHYLFLSGLTWIVLPVAVAKVRQLYESWFSSHQLPEMYKRAALLLAISLVLSPNYVRCARDLLASAHEYRQHWDDIIRSVHEARAKGEQRVEVRADPAIRPATVFNRSWLKEAPDEWPNVNYAKYFGVREFVAVPNDTGHR